MRLSFSERKSRDPAEAHNYYFASLDPYVPLGVTKKWVFGVMGKGAGVGRAPNQNKNNY